MRFILTSVLALLGLRGLDAMAGSTNAVAVLLMHTLDAIEHSAQVAAVFGNPSILLGAAYLLLCYGVSCELLDGLFPISSGLYVRKLRRQPA